MNCESKKQETGNRKQKNRGLEFGMSVLKRVAEKIIEKKPDRTMLVCVDGVDTAGKTTFADKLAHIISEETGINVARAGIDGFHNPREIRMRRGSLSPEGFYHDSFDYNVLIQNVLKPAIHGADYIVPSVYDYRSESDTDKKSVHIDKDTVVLIDGIFMLRPEIVEFWDLSIFLHIDFDEVLTRAVSRDLDYFGSEENVIRCYNERYIPGERLYLESVRPQERADILIDNNDYNDRRILRI